MMPVKILKKGEAMNKECCGTCKWHKLENVDEGWVCVNADSDNVADWTEYEDSCMEWEAKDD